MNPLKHLDHLDVVERALWTFVQGFLGGFVILAPGIWLAPNLTDAKAAAVAALAAGLAAGVSAIKNYVKQIRF